MFSLVSLSTTPVHLTSSSGLSAESSALLQAINSSFRSRIDTANSQLASMSHRMKRKKKTPRTSSLSLRCRARRRPRQLRGPGRFYWWYAGGVVFPSFVDARHLGRYGPEGQFCRVDVSQWIHFPAVTCSVSGVPDEFGIWILGDDFMKNLCILRPWFDSG